MAGDRARLSYDPTRKWRGTVAQQGRVTVEADINEAAAIADERDRLTTLDVVGPVGTPDGGYAVTAFGAGNSSGATPGDLQIGAGTLYLGGERLDLDDPVAYSTQPDWLDHSTDPLWKDPAIPESDGSSSELITLRAIEIEVSATEDPALADVALGGPDTMQRRRILQRFARHRVKSIACDGAWKEFTSSLAQQGLGFNAKTMLLESTTSLLVSFTNTVGQPSLCEPVATGGYLGAENQLIRVMITSVDPKSGTPTIVWGFDDASFLYRLNAATYDAGSKTTTVTLASAPVDSFHFPGLGDAVELLRDAVQLTAADYIASPSGFVSELTAAYDPPQMQLVISGQPPDDYLAATPQLYLRVWKGTAAAPMGQAIALGDTGLAVTLSSSGNFFNVGDFWVFAVRPIDPAIVYPQRYLDAPQPPEGPRTWVCPLAVVTWEQGEATVAGCVPPFDNLVKLTGANSCGCTVTVGPGDVADGATLPALIAGLANRGPVSVCLQPGTYTLTEPIVLGSGFGNFNLRGCDDNVVLQAADPAGPQFTLGLIVVQGGWGPISFEGISLILPMVAFTPPSEAFIGLVPANQQLMTAFSAGLSVAIGVSIAGAVGMTVRDCRFLFPEIAPANVFGAGVYSSGMQENFELTDCRFEGYRQPDEAPYYDLTVGNQAPPPYPLFFGFLQVPSGPVGDVIGKGSLPDLHDAAIERCVFERITVPALSMAQIGTVRIDQNTVRDCYGGFWLISMVDEATITLIDRIAVGDPRFFVGLARVGLAALADRILVMATAMARVLPATPPSQVSAIFRRILVPSEQVIARAQRTFGAIYSAAAATAGLSQPATPAGEAAAAAGPGDFTFVINPKVFVEQVVVPTSDTGASVTLRLEVCDCQVDAVIASSYSGAGLLVADFSQTQGSMLLHGCRVRNRFPSGETFSSYLLAEATVTGNIIANEVPPPTDQKDTTLFSRSIAMHVASPYGVPAIAVTGNVFIDPTLLPDRPSTLPADLVFWDVLNTVVAYVPPPAVSSVSPNTGSTAGGDPVTILGTAFTNATTVNFGDGNPASSVTVQSDTQIAATSPAGTGTVDITVMTPAGTSAITPADQFTYVAPTPVGAAGAAKAAAPKAQRTQASQPAAPQPAAPEPTSEPKTPRQTSRTPSTATTRPMKRPDPADPSPGTG